MRSNYSRSAVFPKAMRAAALLFVSCFVSCVFAGCGRNSLEVLERVHSDAVLISEAGGMTETAGSLPEEGTAASESMPAAGEGTGSDLPGSRLVVYVCGEVRFPGVYELPAGARAVDAIEAAGGLTEEADLTAVNQARPLSDGEMLTIYKAGDSPAGEDLSALPGREAGTAAGEADPKKVNINTADAAELTTLRGIGEARARDIIAYREEHGPFSSIEDIMKVSGIKNAAFSKIKDDICVS